jgi:hypothetical protein
MTDMEVRKCRMLVRVREFGAAHRDLFTGRSVAGQLFAAVSTAADALLRHETTELAGRGGEQDGAASKAAARTALRRQLSAIAQTAQASEVPGLGTFRVPLAGSDERLLSQARTFLEQAKPFARTFVAHELPSNFLGELRARIEALEQATRERAASRDRRVAARARIEAAMQEGLRAVRRLNAIVPNRLDDPAAVALWAEARRVDYGARAKADGAAVQPGPAADTPAA